MALTLVGLMILYFNYPFTHKTPIILSDPSIIAINAEIDSLQKMKEAQQKPKLYPFNPNYITDYKSYTLGMTLEQFNKLKAYRAEGKWINSVEEFKTVTGVTNTWLDSIGPYFKFPEWVTAPRTKQKSFTKANKTYAQKLDLNTATVPELELVYGVGNTLAQRIVKYRDQIGSFSSDVQLLAVYGLPLQTIENIKKEFTVKTPKKINTLNINTATASDLATIPQLSFSLAKKIWEYRVLREKITSLEELTKFEEITPQKLALFKLYLKLE